MSCCSWSMCGTASAGELHSLWGSGWVTSGGLPDRGLPRSCRAAADAAAMWSLDSRRPGYWRLRELRDLVGNPMKRTANGTSPCWPLFQSLGL